MALSLALHTQQTFIGFVKTAILSVFSSIRSTINTCYVGVQLFGSFVNIGNKMSVLQYLCVQSIHVISSTGVCSLIMVTADTFFTGMRHTIVKKFVRKLNIVIYDICKIERTFMGKLIWQILIPVVDVFCLTSSDLFERH